MTLDEQLFHHVNVHWTHPVLDWWSAMVSATDVWLLPSAALLGIAFWRGTPRVRATAALALAIVAISDATFVRVGKRVFERPRPSSVTTVRSVRLEAGGSRLLAPTKPIEVAMIGPVHAKRMNRSFPSGHAWNSFAAATVLALAWRRWGWTSFLVSGAIGLARVHAGLHWPSDVIISALLGIGSTVCLLHVIRRALESAAPGIATLIPHLGHPPHATSPTGTLGCPSLPKEPLRP